MRSSPIGLTVIACLAAAAAHSQTPAGEPFPINDFTLGSQGPADAARQPGRSFVVVWQSEGADGDGTAVRARRFSGNGNPLSDEFAVNETTTGSQWAPRVATDSAGNFVVVWNGPHEDGHGVFARRFTADGTALGPDFQVNTQAPITQPRPTVSRNGRGDFLVAWTDAVRDQVLAATFKASGAVSLPEFVVNETQDLPFGYGSAAGLRSDGGFVVAWVAAHEVLGAPTNDVFQRRFAADGTPLSGEFQLSDPGPNGWYFSNNPDLSVDANDDFFVVWHTQLNLEWGAEYGRRTSAAGTTGPTKQLGFASYGHGFSRTPSGEFVVVWEEYDCCLRGGRFDAAGNPVATFIPGGEFRPGLVHLSDDVSDFVALRAINWPDWDYVGQRFGGPIFVDGFESGDTSEWPDRVPNQ